MHEDIIRQRFEEYYCDEYNMERLERHGNGFYISPLAKREWKTWKTAYASMREIEEQPELDHIKVYPDHPLFRQLLTGKPAAPDKAIMEEMAGAINREWIAVDKSQEGIPLCEFGHGGVWVALPFETLEVLRRAARQALSKYRNAAPAAPDSGDDALAIFEDCCVREYHAMGTQWQIEHYEIDLRMSGDQYRQFIAALSKKRGG